MIHRFEKILVPIDFSETSLTALEYAKFIAQTTNSEITLIHVHETSGFSSQLKNLLFKSNVDKKQIDDSVEKQLNELAAQLKTSVNKVNVVFKSEDNKVYKQITDSAGELGCDLIVMGAKGAKAGDKFTGGANAFRVVATAPCPVITVNKNNTIHQINNIVLPIDTSRETREKVDDAIYFAKTFNAKIHIVAVTSSDDSEIYNHLKKVASQVQNFIQEDKIECTSDFYAKTNITVSTLNHAKKVNGDLIIMMTEQEPSSLFMGPFAQQMINTSDIPVLSIRPVEKDMDFVRPY